MRQGSPEALLATIAQSSNEMTQGWMRLMSSAQDPSGVPAWLAALQAESARLGELQAAYLEKQARLWATLVQGPVQERPDADPGDRRFASKAWSEDRKSVV